jgi:hypothetical protein
MSFGKKILKILRIIGNAFTLGLYQWLKKHFDE